MAHTTPKDSVPQTTPKAEGPSTLGKIGKSIWDVLMPEKKLDQPATPATAAPQSAPTVQEPISEASAAKLKSGVVDDELLAKLWAIIEEKNLNGFDFFEFNRILDGDKSMHTASKYEKAYSVMKALDSKNKAAKATLTSSAAHYLSVLVEEKNGFESGFQDLVEQRVGVKRRELEAVTKEVEDLDEQRKAIEKKINEQKTKMASLEDDISKQDIELQRQRTNFLITLEAVTNDIQGKLDNIQQFVPNDETATATTK